MLKLTLSLVNATFGAAASTVAASVLIFVSVSAKSGLAHGRPATDIRLTKPYSKAIVVSSEASAALPEAIGLPRASAAQASAARSAIGQPTRYEQVKALLTQIVAESPQNAVPIVIGQNDSGEMIVGLQIGHGTIHSLVVATHHGNEYGSTVVATYFARALAHEPLDGHTVYVIPVLNISGYNARRREESVQPGRTLDPNRDYPGPCGGKGPFKLKSTAALARFIEEKNIVTSATLHTYSPAVVYPWGMATNDLSTRYDELFAKLCKAATVESGYQTGNSAKVIYPANGSFEDYAFWKLGIWSILFELGFSHNPNQAQLAELVKVNLPGLRRLIVSAPDTRATAHKFEGRCDAQLNYLDRHDE